MRTTNGIVLAQFKQANYHLVLSVACLLLILLFQAKSSDCLVLWKRTWFTVLMRIIAGSLKSRQFVAPPGRRSHPMSEKMRGALFSMLSDISELTVLDAFAGSGALSYEAVSRGAKHVYAIEKSAFAYRTIKKNVESLELDEKMKATRANVNTWSDNNRDLQLDVVICDPPYDAIRPDVLSKLTQHLKPGGIYVLSWPGSEEIPSISGLEVVRNSNYGDSQLVFYQKTG